jgi:hypothetical protein
MTLCILAKCVPAGHAALFKDAHHVHGLAGEPREGAVEWRCCFVFTLSDDTGGDTSSTLLFTLSDDAGGDTSST